MIDENEAKACASCGRRFVAPQILEAGRCPACSGELVPLDEGPFRDPPHPADR